MSRFPALALAAALAAARTPAALAACEAPGWTKAIEVKKGPTEVVGAGKGKEPDAARKDARRTIARKILQKNAAKIFAWGWVKSKVNRNVYAKDEILQAMVPALAYDIREKDLRKLQTEKVCDAWYVGVAVDAKALLDRLEGEEAFADHVNLALTGQLEPLEAKRFEAEDEAAGKDLANPETTAQRLVKLAGEMRPEDVLESQLALAMKKKSEKILAASKAAKALEWPDKRRKAIAQVEELGLAAEKFMGGVRELRRKELITAFDVFNAMASTGDEHAQFVVGYCYYDARGVKRDYKEAMSFLKRAADQGHVVAKMMIGVLYLSGQGVKADAQEAFRWLGAASQEGWACEVALTQCRKR